MYNDTVKLLDLYLHHAIVSTLSAILDIPVYKNTSQHNEKVQALHVLFTLFSEFKNSQVNFHNAK